MTWFRGMAAVLIGALLMLGLVVPAHAASKGKLVLVLDSSGSMKARVGGQSKISIAKASLRTVIGKLPNDAQVGLRVYGATVFDRKQKGACTDSQLVVPIGTDNRAQLRDEVAKYQPYGETPISYSLLQAADDLGRDGKRSILLVSDGEETCDADPCAVARKLAKADIDLKIDVVGLAVSGKVRSQLQCIADRGRGTYYDARDRDDLEESLDKLATRAFRPFRVTGTPVKGTTSKDDAPTIGVGQYVDTAPASTRKLYYRVPRTIPGSTIHVGFTALVTGGKVFNVGTAAVRLSGPDTYGCGSNFLSQGVTVVGSTPLVGAEADSWEADPSSECNTGDLLLEVYTFDLKGRPFELVVTEEPPVTAQPTAPSAKRGWQSMDGLGKRTSVPVPGTSFSDAAPLTTGVYAGRILRGENQVFAVDADWGQRVQVEAILPPRTGALARAMDYSAHLDVQLFGANRGDYRKLPVRRAPRWDVLTSTDAMTFRTGGSTPVIRYANRRSSDRDHIGSVPGPQYVALGMSRDLDGARYLVPYVLKIRVIGAAGRGAPTYATPPTPSPAATPSSSAEPTPAATPAASTASSDPADPSPGVPVGLVVGIGLGAAALGVAGAVVASAIRRRRTRP